MKMSVSKRLLALVMCLCLAIPFFAVRTANAAVTLTGIDTLMIYNPLVYYEQWVYDDYAGWEQNIVTNTLSTGNMSGQIKTAAGSVDDGAVLRETEPSDGIIRLTPQQIRELTDNKYIGEADDIVEPASTVRAVGDTKAFWIQPNLSSDSTRAKTTMTCRATGTYCNIWGNSTFTSTSIASQMASEFDNLIYINDTTNFGSARFAEDGVKVNILVYTISFGGSSSSICGYFTGADLYTAAELGTSASSYNADSPIIHLNAFFCTSTYVDIAYVTMAHEFQHLICFTSMKKNPNNENEDELGTWLNESMAMQAEEISYPGEVATQGYITGAYNESTDIAGGQSLFCFDTNNDIGVYGQGFMFSEYLKAISDNNIFRRIHSTWRTCAANLLNDGADLETALGSSVVSTINNSVGYDSATISAINNTDNSTDTTQDSVSVFLSKLNLNFQIATVLKENSGIHSLGSGCAAASPLLNTATTVSIQGGGRVYVKTADGNSYTVPTGADSKLIYVGFKNGEMVIAPTTAAAYNPSTDPSLTLPSTLSVSIDGTGSLTADIKNFTPTSITWTSGTPSVATVSGNGSKTAVITPVSEGTTIITCTATDGATTLDASCTVTVSMVDQYQLVTTPTDGKQYLMVYDDGANYYGVTKVPANQTNSYYPYGTMLYAEASGDNVVFTLANNDLAASVSELEFTVSASGSNWRFLNADGKHLAFDNAGYPTFVSNGLIDWTLATMGSDTVSFRNALYTLDNYVYLGWHAENYLTYSTSAVGFKLYEKVEPIIEGSYNVSIPSVTSGIDFSDINIAAGASGTTTQGFQISCSEISGCTVSVAVTSQNNWKLVCGTYSFDYSVSTTSFTFTENGTQSGNCIIDLSNIDALNLPAGSYQFTDSLTFTIASTPLT